MSTRYGGWSGKELPKFKNLFNALLKGVGITGLELDNFYIDGNYSVSNPSEKLFTYLSGSAYVQKVGSEKTYYCRVRLNNGADYLRCLFVSETIEGTKYLVHQNGADTVIDYNFSTTTKKRGTFEFNGKTYYFMATMPDPGYKEDGEGGVLASAWMPDDSSNNVTKALAEVGKILVSMAEAVN